MSENLLSEETLLSELSTLPITFLRLNSSIVPNTVLSSEEFLRLVRDEWRAEEASLFYSLVNAPTAAPLLAWLANGNDINARDTFNFTLLHYAIRHGASLEIVKFLLDNGAEVDARDSNGMTPLMYAAEINFPTDILTALLSAGADANAHDADGWTALIYAAHSRAPKPAILILLKAGADLNPGIFDQLADEPNAPEFPDFEYMYFEFIESKSVPSYLVDPDYPGPECPIYEHFYVSNGPRPTRQYDFDGYHLIDPIEEEPETAASDELDEPQPTEVNVNPDLESTSDESQLPTAQDGIAHENPEMTEAFFKNFPKPIVDVVSPYTNATTASKTRPAFKPVSNPVLSFVPRSRRRRTAKGQILLDPCSLPLTLSFINCRNCHVPPKKYHDTFLYLATGAALMFVSLIFIVVACV